MKLRIARGLLLMAFMLTTGRVWAQETAPASGLLEEVRQLRQLVEQQNRTLTRLSEQVDALRQRLEVPSSAPSSTPPVSTPPEAETSTTTSTPVPPVAPNSNTEPPRAEATGGGIKHIVAKGETLTSVAKRYNIPLADLMKANPIQNDRALQIGQVLKIPTPNGAPAPEPTDKKENP